MGIPPREGAWIATVAVTVFATVAMTVLVAVNLTVIMTATVVVTVTVPVAVTVPLAVALTVALAVALTVALAVALTVALTVALAVARPWRRRICTRRPGTWVQNWQRSRENGRIARARGIGNAAPVLTLPAVLTTVPPILHSVVASSMKTTSNLGPPFPNFTHQSFNYLAFLPGDGTVVERRNEVLMISFPALLWCACAQGR